MDPHSFSSSGNLARPSLAPEFVVAAGDSSGVKGVGSQSVSAMDSRSILSSGNQDVVSMLSPEQSAVAGNSSGVKAVGSVDPRWPLLNRWSSPMVSPSLAPKSDVTLALVSGSGPIQQTSNSTPPLSSNSQDAICELTGFETQTNQVISPNIDMNPASGSVNLQKALTFSTPLGAWKKPLPILSPALQHSRDVMHCVEPQNSQWPPLTIEKPRGQGLKVVHEPLKDSKVCEDSEAYQALLKAQSKEYPWAARMNPSMRNLHRVTIPEYMEDGTPKIRIPSHVLLGGLENQKEFVVGQFYRCLAPTGGQIQAVVTRIWGRKCRIFTRKLGESTYLFHIPDESTRKWVLQRGLWHVDDCLLFVSPWSPADTISIPEITTVPVWLTLLNIPDQLYSILGIKWIASGIGEPLLTEKPWLDPTQMGKAKILVEVKLDKPFPKRVALIDKSDAVTMVDVSYSWLPSTCSSCGQLGHKASRCLLLSANAASPPKINLTVDSSKFIANNGKVPITDVRPVAQMEIPERGNSPSSVPITTSPVCAQERNEMISATTATSASPKAKGTSSTTQEKSSTNVIAPTTFINNFGVVKSNETTTIAEASPPAIVERSFRRSLSNTTLGNNRFSSLDSSEDEENTMDFDNEPEQGEFLTPAGKRILRERPVKPSTKVKEMQWLPPASGRGNRGRGNRGGRG